MGDLAHSNGSHRTRVSTYERKVGRVMEHKLLHILHFLELLPVLWIVVVCLIVFAIRRGRR